jgi:serine kinase of HPr protein (carbohydrate metabolism regulator)
MLTLHASCVAIAGVAVLLRGPSGAGKSDLTLRLLDAGAGLVADDQTCLLREGRRLIASAPPALRGLLEIRGLGPVAHPAAAPTPVALLIDLVQQSEVPRLPEPRFEDLLDVSLPCLALHAFEASAAAKVKWALARAAAGQLFEPEQIHASHTAGAITELFKRQA